MDNNRNRTFSALSFEQAVEELERIVSALERRRRTRQIDEIYEPGAEA